MTHRPRAPEPPSPAPADRAQRAPRPPRPARNRLVLVDGSNVAHFGEGARACLAHVLLVRDKLAAQGFEPVIVADAALRHQIDETERYEQLVKDGAIKQAPAGTDADYFILSFAKELEARILSNDRFRDRIDAFPILKRRMIRYMIVAGEVVLERRGGKRPKESNDVAAS